MQDKKWSRGSFEFINIWYQEHVLENNKAKATLLNYGIHS